MIIDPWGNILTSRREGNGIIYAPIDLESLKQIRKNLPCLRQRRKDLFSKARSSL